MNKTKELIKDGIILIVGLVIMIIVLIIMMNLYLIADRDRCMTMPFSKMMDDESCSMYWEAIEE